MYEFYRVECKHLRQAHTNYADMDKERDPAAGLPSVDERNILWLDFWELHKLSFRTAIYSACKVFKIRCPPSGLTAEIVFFKLSYNHNSGGNPVKMFNLDDASMGKMSDAMKLPSQRKAWEGGRERREQDAATFRAGDPSFQGFIPVLCSIDSDYVMWTYEPVFSPQERDAEVEAILSREGPFDRLVLWLGHGWFKSQDQPGELVKEGEQWKWRAFPTAKLTDLKGLPPGYYNVDVQN